MAREPYWIPSPKGGDRVHRWEIHGSKQSCWVVSLEKDESGKYLFPFAEELVEILEPSGKHETKAKDDGVVG
jgi:hypothetical protein